MVDRNTDGNSLWPALDLVFRIDVPKPVTEVWKYWSTEDGLRSFFSPNLDCSMRVQGKFEIFFDMNAPYGSRGSEGMQVMAVEENNLLSFSWNQPPSLPDIRHQQTMVTVRFSEYLKPYDGSAHTGILFTHAGFGLSENWKRAREYFRRAWGEIVLARFSYCMQHGAYDWEAAPDVSAYAVAVMQ